MKKMLKTLLPPALLLAAVFLSAFVLFAELQPFVIFDTDDWQNISFTRKAIPSPAAQNPTRVFPEIMMPLCANVAAYVIMPLCGVDFVDAFTIVCAMIASLFITVYVGLFYALVRKRCFLEVGTGVLVTAFFYLLHFIVLSQGVHLFYANSPTNLFYYVLSGLLCASIVLYLMRIDMLDTLFTKRDIVKKGVFIAMLYLALISNLFASVIIAAYVGLDLILGLLKTVRRKSGIEDFFKQSIPKLIVLLAWLIVQFLETLGRRAHTMSETATGLAGVGEVCGMLINCDYDVLFIGLVAVIAVAFLFVRVRVKGDVFCGVAMRCIDVCCASAVIVGCYLVLICAFSESAYIRRPDVLFSLFFFIITAMALAIGIFVKCWPHIVLALPIAILFLVCYFHPESDSVAYGLTSEDRGAIARDIIEQVQKGVENGDGAITVRVPAFDSVDNWPLSAPAHIGSGMARSFYRLGLVDRAVAIEITPSIELNTKYGLAVPDDFHAS